ncbi:MAG: nucleotidyltransferase domain-containing protein [Melioribacteraceae bacterium]|nr:nucleotidyltransferase domain-containing protein [Melioribacteraceae bacterium]
MVTKKVREIIRKYISELEKNGLNISKVFLYGSHAYGKPNRESDIDLLIVSPQFDNIDSGKYSAKLWLATEVVDFIIEPIGVGEKFFNSNEFSPLLDLVKAKGEEIAA